MMGSKAASLAWQALGLSALAAASTASGSGTARAADAAPVALSEVQVEVGGAPLAHDTGLTLLPGSIQDTPQAITVIPALELQQQGVATIEQALRNVPGITIAIGEGGTLNGDQFKIRGFDASNDVYVDGLRDFGVYTRDSFDVQEVEVLKGPSGAMFGRGTTGGVINSVSKSPTTTDLASVDAMVGNGDDYRAVGDFNKALNGTTAVRLTLMGNSTGVVDRDVVYSHRWGAAAAIGFGLGTDTTLVARYLHQEDRRIPDYGIVIGQPRGSLIALPVTEYGAPRSNFMSFDTDRDHTRADVLTVKFKSRLAPGLTFTSDSRVGVYDRYFQYTTVDGCYSSTIGGLSVSCADALLDSDPSTVPTGAIGGGGPYDQHAWGVQTINAVRADFHLGGFKTQFIGGLDLSYQDSDKTFFAYTLPSAASFAYLPATATAKPPSRNLIPVNLLTPNHTPPPGYAVFRPTVQALTNTTGIPGTTVTSGTFTTYASGDATDLAAFLTDRFWVSPQWSVIGGVRLDRYDAKYQTVDVRSIATSFKAKSNFANPRGSLVFEPTGAQTYYVSWGKAATPVGTAIVGTANPLAAATQAFAPEKSETYEAGAKLALLRGRLGVAASAFRVAKDNAKQTDPVTGLISSQSSQRQEVKGVELSLNGRLTRAWTVNAAYTYLDSRIASDLSCGGTPAICLSNPYTMGREVAYVPKNAVSLWTSYALDPIAKGLSVGGGVTYQSKLYLGYTSAGTAPNITGLSKISMVPENVSLDGFVAYQSGPVRIALNGYNLTDRLNYAQVFSNRAVPAAGRTVILTVGFAL